MRSLNGCWTCRLRRKRCDEAQPICQNCSSLHIVCHHEKERPSWMDGAEAQREKAEEVKREVKSAGSRRRGNGAAHGRLDTPSTVREYAVPLTPDAGFTTQHATPTQLASRNLRALQGLSNALSPVSTLSFGNGKANAIQTRPQGQLNSAAADITANEPELDRRFMMFYFDHFFPFLFPFYAPPLLDGGRWWIMELVVSNLSMWHTTLSLSTYFVSVVLDGAASERNLCKTLAWEKLIKQMSETYSALQLSLQDLSSCTMKEVIVKTGRVMGSIVQLQRFEIASGNLEHCREHLDAAVELFRRVFQCAAVSNGSHVEHVTLEDVLIHMGLPLWALNSQHRRAWGSNQAAIRFYAALLIVDDIVASACTGQAPQLLEYHTRLLANNSGPDDTARLHLADFTGCETWVMLQISEMAVLETWKKSMKRAGQLDTMELAARASVIKQALLENIASLKQRSSSSRIDRLSCFDIYKAQSAQMGVSRTFVTCVWAYGAGLYLSIVVSGWQPKSLTIRSGVMQVLAYLEQIPAPELLRTMVWPFCIAGCLAQPGEEDRFRALADALVPNLFGGARKALEIMENVWRSRNELNFDTDLASCIRSLGYVPLLA